MGEIDAGDDLPAALLAAIRASGTALVGGDCLVVTQKVVSKAEGRLVPVPGDSPDGRRAVAEQQARRVLRRRGDLLITETAHGFVCANSGVDCSNVPNGTAALLPVDPDRSARTIRTAVRRAADVDVAVIVSDTFGRPWRNGLVDVALGVAGLQAIVDLRGDHDAGGRPLEATEIAVADEVAGAAELVMGKAQAVPAAIVRGLDASWRGEGAGRQLVRAPADDLFR